MPTPQEARKWFLDLGGRRKGPLSIRDIEALLQEGAVFPSTPLMSNEPGAKPTTVQEVLRSSRVSSPPGLPPRGPRPAPPISDSKSFDDYESDDPVTDLFNTYQAAKERTSQSPPLAPPPSSTGIDVSVLRWKWLAFVALGGMVLAGAVHFLLDLKKAPTSEEQPTAIVGATPVPRTIEPTRPTAAPVVTHAVPDQPVPQTHPQTPTETRRILDNQSLQRRKDQEEEEERRNAEARDERTEASGTVPDLDGKEINKDKESESGGLTPANLRD